MCQKIMFNDGLSLNKDSLEEIIRKVEQWGEDKGIENIDKQYIKGVEEYSELGREIVRGRYKSTEAKDAIGDTVVVLIILSKLLGFNLYECLEHAWGEIKNRTGKTIKGSFVKDE